MAGQVPVALLSINIAFQKFQKLQKISKNFKNSKTSKISIITKNKKFQKFQIFQKFQKSKKSKKFLNASHFPSPIPKVSIGAQGLKPFSLVRIIKTYFIE